MDPLSASDACAAVLDASFLVGFCAREGNKYEAISVKLNYYLENGWLLFAPGVAIGEAMFAFCKKRSEGALIEEEYSRAVDSLAALMRAVNPPPGGEASLIANASRIHSGYGCSRMSDSFSIALTEHLQTLGAAELATTDAGLKTQAQTKAPSVIVELLPVSP